MKMIITIGIEVSVKSREDAAETAEFIVDEIYLKLKEQGRRVNVESDEPTIKE